MTDLRGANTLGACKGISVYLYVCMYVRMYVRMYVHVCMFVWSAENVCVYLCTCGRIFLQR